MQERPKTFVKITTKSINVEIVGEPFLINTWRGYTPAVTVKVEGSDEHKGLYINAKTLSNALEPMRLANDGNFKGLKFKIRKESSDRTAPYIIEKVE